MSELKPQYKLDNLAEYMQNKGDKPYRVYKGEIVGATFYDPEKGIRNTPRIYIDADSGISVRHSRVYIIEISTGEEGIQE